MVMRSCLATLNNQVGKGSAIAKAGGLILVAVRVNGRRALVSELSQRGQQITKAHESGNVRGITEVVFVFFHSEQ